MNCSHLTALTRKQMSAPSKHLVNSGLLQGSIIDYGSGKGFDAELIGATPYDPHFSPELDTALKVDTIYCNFVLNVIEDPDERAFVLLRIQHFLRDNGIAYITVRADKKKLNGATKRGTWQGLIELNLPVQKRTANWVMYRLTKTQSLA